MNQRGFVPIIFLLIIAVLIAAGALYYENVSNSLLGNGQHNIACTQEAKQCPDGSYVGRVAPSCSFAPCPNVPRTTECKLDSDCPSSAYVCQAIESSGVASPNNGSPSVMTIIKGECKLKEGNRCSTGADCVSGLLCHNSICTNPIGQSCSGPNGACPVGYTCIQSCGPPVARVGDLPPPYFCELNEFASKPRMCPICLASNTMIATPRGEVNVRDIQVKDLVWSLDNHGKKIKSAVVKVSSTLVPPNHTVVHLVLSDGRNVYVSPNHPTVQGIPVGDLHVGDQYDGADVESVDQVAYWDQKTYDILPDSDTGYYWANGILLKSTLRP